MFGIGCDLLSHHNILTQTNGLWLKIYLQWCCNNWYVKSSFDISLFLVVKCSLLGHGLFLTLQRLRCCSKACRVLGSSYPSSIQSRLQQSLLNFWLNLLLKTSKKILLTCHEAPHLDPPWSHHPMMAGKDLSYLNPLKCLRWIGSIWSRSRHGHVTVIRQM